MPWVTRLFEHGEPSALRSEITACVSQFLQVDRVFQIEVEAVPGGGGGPGKRCLANLARTQQGNRGKLSKAVFENRL